MSLILLADSATDLPRIDRDALELDAVPCVCWVDQENFRVTFTLPLFEMISHIRTWERCKLEQVAPALAGVNYSHHYHGLITMERLTEGEYRVVDLKFFYRSVGWIQVVKNGDYATPQF